MNELKIEDVTKFVNDYKTTHREGFTDIELAIILNTYDNINEEKFHKAFFGSTFTKINNQNVRYHCDVLTALKCGIENRDMSAEEWD